MPRKGCANGIEPTPLRRSKRLLDAVAAKVKKLHSKEIEVPTSPITSASLKSSITLVENVPCKKIGKASKKPLVESASKSANCQKSKNGWKASSRKNNPTTPEASHGKICGKTNNGSSVSARKINGAEGFQGCRRSPRFSFINNTPEILDKKTNGVRKSNGSTKGSTKVDGVEGFHGCVGSSLVPISENTPEMCVKKNNGIAEYEGCRKSSRLAIVEKTPEIFHKEAGNQLKCSDPVDYMDKEVTLKGTQNRKSVKRGRKILEVNGSKENTGQPELDIMTPDNGKERKKRNLNCRTDDMFNEGDSKGCKKYSNHQNVHKLTFGHLRTPLSSIEEISSKQAQAGVHNISPTQLVGSTSGLRKYVKSACELSIKSENNRLISNRCGVQGWTKDQELALQKAYFAAKPSPGFWKKISKMVPGKSAQDCFDKVQSNNITPSQPNPRYRSRTNRINLSPLCHFSLSAGKLLEPTKLNAKRSRVNKRTKCFAQKTVRHILQKQNQVNQGHQRDLFSILEPSVSSFTQVSPEINALTTPKCGLNKLRNYQQRSSSSSKKPHSRLRDSSKRPLSSPSPAVLKHIKNMTSHEKYIDQLHCREARRIAEIRRCASSKDDRKEIVQQPDVIKAAKNALVIEAKDMIKEFQQMQTNMVESSEDLDDVGDSSGGDEAEC